MSYKSGTILTRKTPFEVPEEGSETVDLTPYNEIEVIGQSPVESQRTSEWAGQLGNNLSVRPTTFGQVIDRPFGELQRDYNVKSIPQPRPLDRGEVTVVEPGPSPEEVFAAQADGPAEAARKPRVVEPDAPSPEDVFAQAAIEANTEATVQTTVTSPAGLPPESPQGD